MSAVQSIIARLSESGTPFRLIEGAADLAAIEKRKPPVPAAFVLIAEEAYGDNERATGRILQRVEQDVAVIIVDENFSEARMGAAAADIETLKAFCDRKLIGFEPDGVADPEPLTAISGKLLKARSGQLWFEKLYALSSYQEEQP